MSQGEPMPWERAIAAADRLRTLLRPGCERIEIAGSLRRQKPTVRDIEIVTEARWDSRPVGLLSDVTEQVDALEEIVGALLDSFTILPRLVDNHRADGRVERQMKLGPAYKALVFDDIPVDLFIVRPPATWGCIFALRTGPGDWNTRLVMDCQAVGRRVAGGQVLRWSNKDWRSVPTPEERDFFAALGQPWVEPSDRHVDKVRIERAIAKAVS